jgi:hypothetical protein
MRHALHNRYGAQLWLLLVCILLASCSVRAPKAGSSARPTPVPAPPPYPTMEPRRWLGGSDPHATLQLPGVALDVHIAVHPTEGWPAIAVLQRFNEGATPMQALVRVLNPHTGRWSIGQQVDTGASSNGLDAFGSALIGITGDHTVHAVWGGSDDGGSIWTSMSSDYGASWSTPEQLLTS